ncbi:MAG: hypothetical protein ACJ788_00105 [Ktedonobacteraceae bacterium]
MPLPPQPPIAQDDHDIPANAAYIPNIGIATIGAVGASTDAYNVTTAAEQVTGPTVNLVDIKAISITANTPVSVYTPSIATKKFRVVSYDLSLSVAGSILFEDGAGGASAEFMRTPLLAAGVGQASPSLGAGYLSTTPGNHLFLDVTATGNVSGWITVSEE